MSFGTLFFTKFKIFQKHTFEICKKQSHQNNEKIIVFEQKKPKNNVPISRGLENNKMIFISLGVRRLDFLPYGTFSIPPPVFEPAEIVALLEFRKRFLDVQE